MCVRGGDQGEEEALTVSQEEGLETTREIKAQKQCQNNTWAAVWQHST